MSIQSTAAYLVSSWLRNHCPAKTCQQRSYEHDASSQCGSFLGKLSALQRGYIHILGTERVFAALVSKLLAGCLLRDLLHLYAYKRQKLYQTVDIAYIWYVVYDYLFLCQQDRTDHLQGFVLRSLRLYVAFQSVSSYYFETTHLLYCFLAYFLLLMLVPWG